jgi:hypothetical protein
MLSAIGLDFRVKKLPSVNFFTSRVNLPGLSAQLPSHHTPFKIIHQASDKLDYHDLNVTFKVDEDLTNWLEIFNWMVGMGFPRDFEQRRLLEANNTIGEGLKSDGTLTILTNARNPNYQIQFLDLLPYELSDLELSSQNSDVDYLEATVSFKYTYYTMTRVT